MARQFLLMNGEKGRWRFVAIVNLSSVKWHLPNHVQAKENGEQGSWWCEKQHSRSEHPNPVLLKGESQLQIQHKRCFPTFCTCSQQMGGQVPLRERQTPTLHCKKMRTIWALKEIHDDALSHFFLFFGLTGAQMCKLSNQLLHTLLPTDGKVVTFTWDDRLYQRWGLNLTLISCGTQCGSFCCLCWDH